VAVGLPARQADGNGRARRRRDAVDTRPDAAGAGDANSSKDTEQVVWTRRTRRGAEQGGQSVDGRCYDRDEAELARCSSPAPPDAVAADDADDPPAAAALTNDRLLNNLYQPIAMLARSSESSLIWTTPMKTLRSDRP